MTKLDDDIIIEFPNPRSVSDEDEQLRRLKAEAERLSRQPESEQAYRIPTQAKAFGVPEKTLRAMVNANNKKREREHKQLEKHHANEENQHEKEKERKRHQVEKEAEHAERKAEQEAKRKEKEKQIAFGELAKLAVAQHAKALHRLAERLGEDVETLRSEFEDSLGVGGGEGPDETEPWPSPVDTATLLSEVSKKTSRYVVLQPHQLTAALLWTAHTWLYDHDVPVHSPILAATSAEADSGKTTLITVIGHASPRFSLNVEMTGPSLYRFVDRRKPTMGLDEADDLFFRRSDLKHIINAGWTRGAKIPRQEKIGGVWHTVWFDPFTPKAIALLGRNLPPALRSRCIELRMLPKRPDEKTEAFNQVDDPEFAVLRQKCARWAADNAARLKDAKPTMPSGLNNRAAANWHLLLAIAELAGGTWPQRAREAAERLSRTGRRPSDGVRLLAAMKVMFAESTKKQITSETIVTKLCADVTDIWIEHHHGGPITQRQVAIILDAYDIRPMTIHPTGRSNLTVRGYKLEQFADAFARYLPADPHIRTLSQKVKRLKVKRRS